jgi:hypothetical protein
MTLSLWIDPHLSVFLITIIPGTTRSGAVSECVLALFRTPTFVWSSQDDHSFADSLCTLSCTSRAPLRYLLFSSPYGIRLVHYALLLKSISHSLRVDIILTSLPPPILSFFGYTGDLHGHLLSCD